MTITIRRTEPGELRSVASATRIALLDAPPDDALWSEHLPRWRSLRSFSAWEGERCVGHVASFDMDTTVPGGANLPTVGVSSAGVLPTHVRQGVFTELMAALMDDAASDGRAFASLRASEATIYGRFGFGMAGQALTATVDAARATPLRGAAGGTIELVAPGDILELAREVYSRSDGRPGHISRPDWMWERYLGKAISGHSVENVIAHRSTSGEVDGYAHYELTWSDDIFGADHGTGTVHEVIATDPAVEIALWQFVLTIPLVRSLGCDELAADSVLFHAVADYRAIRVGMQWDEQWVRLLDIDACLAARAWADAAPVVVEVVGAFAATPATTGRWRIGQGTAARTDASPDLVTDIAGISAAYLGSTSWWDLTATNRATAVDPAVVRRADAVFGHRPLAFSGSFF